MSRPPIDKTIERKLYAESMGRCMNPKCRKVLFSYSGDIIEKAHIDPYCKTADDSFENLVVLCPNCHTEFDKNSTFSPEEVKSWKKIRQEEVDKFFSEKFETFDELKEKIVPLLLENMTIFEEYYLKDKKELWDKFEMQILINNRKMKKLLENNLGLIQSHSIKEYSNLACVRAFLLHIDEFEATRCDEKKIRSALFPAEINSLFGIAPICGFMLPSTEALEILITKLHEEDKLEKIAIGIEEPYIQVKENEESKKVFLNDTPRLRQLYSDYGCFRKTGVRLESLNFALKYIRSRKIDFEFLCYNNLREISINDTHLVFVYEYCLSKIDLLKMAPKEESVIVNLHNWNGSGCVSSEAYEVSEKMNVTILTMDDFYGYINEISRGK